MIDKFEPRWIAWEISQRCNLNCVHCRADGTIDKEKGPSTEMAKKIIDDISSYARPVLVLSGGEPLLRKDIFELARYGNDKGLKIALATNGILVTPEICEKIIDSGIKIVSLSLDGATEEVHDDFRQQKGAFKSVIRAAKLFREHGIKFIINSSFTKRNQEDIPEVYRLAKELGATAWYMFMIVPTGRGKEIMEELISREDYDKILNWHYDMEKEEKELLVRPTCAPMYYRIFMQRSKEDEMKFERRNLSFSTGGSKGCIAGQLIALINHRGEVYPCSYFNLSAGNIYEKSFKEIWEESELFKKLRDFGSYKGKCGACEYINVCGGCRARAYAITGDYLEEEPFCSYVPEKLKRK
ncbi:antilisterial bacteriocin subtilosin biosynthesis protein AlbA [archaeon BMS3Bbin15]|nr:antilisterial bacteriocin subtilosin biosynthesis protein AlbA [archaeon BMS3Bbin15]